jgi:hypothetical protein
MDPTKYNDHHGFFWLNGKPGAGKSVTMKYALEHTRSRATQTSVVLSLFFHGRGNALQKSALGMYSSLLHQLLGKLPGLQSLLDDQLPHLQSLMDDQLPHIDDADLNRRASDAWDLKGLRRLFSDVTALLGDRQVTCFVDALDECDKGDVQELVDTFEELGQWAADAGTKLYLCLSSRHYPYIYLCPVRPETHGGGPARPCGRPEAICAQKAPGQRERLHRRRQGRNRAEV